MKFTKSFLKEAVPDLGADLLVNELVDNTRWSLMYRRVFCWGEKYYETYFSVGATECQDEGPYDNEPDEIECDEVFPHEVKIIEYKLTPPGQ